MSKSLKKSLYTILLGLGVAWVSSLAPVVFGFNYTPIYKNNQVQEKFGSLAIGKNSNPLPSVKLEVPGIVVANGFISSGAAGVNIYGNLQVKRLFLDNLTATSTPSPVCSDTNGNLINCL
ncbi:MAG: hypothetical protein NTX85_00865 [Candidatus Nomurabacteria bacterium]|nr:hypothetical protein [Candidatus Nomurabacteria bacterium]